MVRMIPPVPREGANSSEKKIFTALEGIPDRDDWVVIHSLRIARHRSSFVGEADFIVLAPSKGIALIEAKSPSSAKYEDGNWYLENTPNPTKDPLTQLDGVRRSLRGYLKELNLLEGTDPIARMIWFTSLGRHQFENATKGDMQLFEWELAWKDDLAKPAWVIEHLFEEHDRWYGQVEEVEHDPAAFTAERVEELTHALLGNFHVSESVSDRMREREVAEATLLAEQEIILELFERNPRVYLDGPAGTGKSHLLVKAARRNNLAGLRTLVCCWNVLMAAELRSQLGELANVDVFDINELMLDLAGITENPAEASLTWYTQELPALALAESDSIPPRRAYDALLIDEFQDIASMPAVLELLGSLCNSSVLLAGDSRQQIMQQVSKQVDAFEIAKAWMPGLVHVRVSRNCRNIPAITDGTQSMMPSQSLGFTGHRMPKGVPGGFSVKDASVDETGTLSGVLRELLKEYSPEQIVVLSPFAENRSLVGRFLSRSERTRSERWLRKQLEAPGGDKGGRIRWRSIFKFKGLDADAVVVTDVGQEAKAFCAEEGLSFTDLLYVGFTRGKYRCVVLTSK